METYDCLKWEAKIDLHPKDCIKYLYALYRNGELVWTEWEVKPHIIHLDADTTSYLINDFWRAIPDDLPLYSSAFTECVASHGKPTQQALQTFNQTLQLRLVEPRLLSHQHLAICGNTTQLGNWTQPVPLTLITLQEWGLNLDVEQIFHPIEYKYVILDDEGQIVQWEDGPNRRITSLPLSNGEMWVKTDSMARFQLDNWKCAGVVVPVFSLRSEKSHGIGDFGDLKRMIHWAASAGMNAVQILPINDTTMSHTWQDSYPYNSISIYALHPQYTDFRQLPAIKDEAKRTAFETLRKELNELPQIDYERMFAAKMDYLREIYAQEGSKVLKSKAFKEFFEQNKEWLVPYAAFCHYRDLYGTATFQEWPDHHELPASEREAMTKSTTKLYKEVAFWYFVQFNLDQQMHAAHAHARAQRVILKGDIPIGISRDGVEAWVEPKYFNLNGQAGAPPDPFSADGQNWGFPTYNWDEMLKDGCSWWVRRFKKMAEYFDAYRIDHVLGFFRIWEIPVPYKSGLMGQFSPALGMSREEIEAYGVQFNDGLFLVDHKRDDRWHPRIAVQYQEAYEKLDDGQKANFNRLYNDYFYRRNNQFWYTEAMKKLPKLTQATRMLVCAEDLGMVPDCVPWVMNELRILSLEIQSMPKDSSVRFGHLSRNPYRSVCTISTHDMPTLRQWWDEDEGLTQDYFNSMLYRGGAAPHPLPGWLAKDIVSRHLTSPSMLCLLSFQDWISIDEGLRLPDANAERINIPANPRHYWRYRMHLTIEQLLAADDFNNEISTLIIQSGRK